MEIRLYPLCISCIIEVVQQGRNNCLYSIVYTSPLGMGLTTSEKTDNISLIANSVELYILIWLILLRISFEYNLYFEINRFICKKLLIICM